MKYSPDKKHFPLIVVVCILIMHIAIGIYKVIPLRPQSIHQWAQCDRASVALNYYKGEMNLFFPRVHNIDNGTGITGLEFPFVNYSVAILYKVFGFHEWLYRLLTLIIYSLGLYFVFKFSFWWLNNFWQSLGAMLIFGCSPLLAYYSANFLPEPSSLAFSLAAWYFLTRYIDTRNKGVLWLWCFLMSLSCLIKISSLINLPAMLLFIFINTDEILPRKIILTTAFKAVIILGCTLLWYRYAIWLSAETHSKIFLMRSMFPENIGEFVSVWEKVRTDWFYRIYSDVLLILMFVCLIAGSFRKKINEKKLYILTAVLLISVLTFLFSMWTQLRQHDYYMIPMYPVFLFGLIAIVNLIKLITDKASIVLTVLIPLTIAYQFYETKTHVRTSFKKNSWKYSALHFDNLFEVDSCLRNCGVKKQDKIISIFDNTPDISLYLMDQPGVTLPCGNHSALKTYINSGRFQYLIFDRESMIEGFTFDPAQYPLKLKGSYRSLMIYEVTLPSVNNTTPFGLTPWM